MPFQPFAAVPSYRTRRDFLRAAAFCGGVSVASGGLIGFTGCRPSAGQVGAELVWGGRGDRPGEFEKPRAIAINDRDELFIVDMTARIQVFTADGEFLRAWRTPESVNGRPTGLGIARDGSLLVADTHYFRMLVYTPEGELQETRSIGGDCGTGPGQFHFVTDVVQDSQGSFYIGEYGEYDRIQKFDPDGAFVCQWGSHGSGLDQFERPQALALDADDLLWVADACNHRVLVYDVRDNRPRLVSHWGEMGTEPGKMRYPYGICLDGKGALYVSEFGNHRVQKFSLTGESLACWGSPGRKSGQFHQPWSCALDSRGRLHVLDSYNHRVQRTQL